jgi:nucleoside-diphosphate-sugar epimerase
VATRSPSCIAAARRRVCPTAPGASSATAIRWRAFGLSSSASRRTSADVYRNYDGLRGKGSAPPDPVPLSERAPLRQTLYPYRGSDIEFAHREDYEKILVERAVMNAAEIAGTVLRLPAVYGPGDRQHRLRPYLQQMDEGRAEILLGENQARWRFTRGYVGNVAAAIALAVSDRRAAGQVYNVGDEAAYSEAEWVERIGAAAGWKGAVHTVPDDQLPEESGQPHDWRNHLFTDTTRIREELGFREPIPLEAALEATLRWERSVEIA